MASHGSRELGRRLVRALDRLPEPEESALTHGRTVAGVVSSGRPLLDLLQWLDRELTLDDRELFAVRTYQAVRRDLRRLGARLSRSYGNPEPRRLHLGCGRHRYEGWLNVDLGGSDDDVDLAGGRLPWADSRFEAVVSIHVIEHLDLETELLPLLVEIHRVCAPNADVWIGCPDLGAICRGYVRNRGRGLLKERDRYWPGYGDLVDREAPPQDIVNNLFHQWGEHRNLFDFELLAWILRQTGFDAAIPVGEGDLVTAYPEVRRVGYERHTLWVCAHCNKDRDPNAALRRLRTARREALAALQTALGDRI